ncbi:MAG: hypothetical protein ACKVX9_24590, partial [Blastocatellia bacterium]
MSTNASDRHQPGGPEVGSAHPKLRPSVPPSILDALGVAALICTPSAQVTFATAAARMLLVRGDAIRLVRQPGGSDALATSDRQTTM